MFVKFRTKRAMDNLFSFLYSKQEFFIGPLVHAATAVLYVNAIKADNIQPFYSPSDTPPRNKLGFRGRRHKVKGRKPTNHVQASTGVLSSAEMST